MCAINETDDPIARLRCLPLGAGTAASATAAVLAAVVVRPIPTLLFTTRSRNVSHHPGQVCFPGGRCEKRDRSFVATALRETWEETGIPADMVTVLGHLNPVETLYGQIIAPVLALLQPDYPQRPNAEVADIFEVPVAFFLDPANRSQTPRQAQNRVWQYYVYCYKNHRIEGATAAIVADLAARMRA